MIDNDFVILENLYLNVYKKDDVIEEKLILKKYTSSDDGKVYFVVDSDLEGAAKNNETFKNKEKIKNSGLFVFDSKNLRKWVSKKSYEPEEFNGVVPEYKKIISQINQEDFTLDLDSNDIQDYAETGMQDKISQFLNDLKIKIKENIDSPEIQAFLNFKNKFRKYSFNNQMLIFIQKPNATHIAGKRKWEKDFNRKLKLGAKGIYIYVPIKGKTEEPNLSQPTPNVDETKNSTFFILKPVFDISDTEVIAGKEDKVASEPKWYSDTEIDDKTEVIYNALESLSKTQNIRVDISSSGLDGARGVSRVGSIQLLIKNISTFVHEIAHELLHGTEERINGPWLKQIHELEAESVAYVVLREYDLPSEHASKYLALWKIDPENIKTREKDIQQVASFIINYINIFAGSGEEDANTFISSADKPWEDRKKDWKEQTTGVSNESFKSFFYKN
jgi:hypothetical protein